MVEAPVEVKEAVAREAAAPAAALVPFLVGMAAARAVETAVEEKAAVGLGAECAAASLGEGMAAAAKEAVRVVVAKVEEVRVGETAADQVVRAVAA